MKLSSTNIVLIDDHEMVRRGLRALLHLEPDMTIVAEAGTVADGVAAVERLAPHMVLLDVKLPDASLTEACRRLLAVAPKLRILVLTSYAEDSSVMAAVQNGAHGYVLKDIRMDERPGVSRPASHPASPTLDSDQFTPWSDLSWDLSTFSARTLDPAASG
jgi:two-component system, NarL family, response regulator DevR